MKKMQASILLVFVFMARGTSFLFSKELMNTMSPMSVLAVRFILAFLILVLVLFKRLYNCSKKSLTGGLILGVLYTICMVFEMYGLRLIDTGTSALIENMAIVLVPLYAAVLTKSLPKKKTMLCAVLAVIGFGFAFQPVGQKYVSAEAAAIMTVVNPLTASILGIIAAGESISAAKIIGYALILISLLMYHLNVFKKSESCIEQE